MAGNQKEGFDMKIKIFVLFITLSLILCGMLVAIGGKAAAGSFDEDIEETKSEATEIYDWYDLDNVRDDLDGDYILMNDLDGDTDGYEELVVTEKGWEPIGESDPDEDVEFTGTFDGNGQEVRDLFIERPDENYVGLFGFTYEGAEIIDVGVVDAEVTGDLSVGALVGSNGGNISDSYATGEVVGDMWVGGLSGYHFGENITISNSFAEAEVLGNSDVGGLLGRNHEIVENSYARGEVVGDSGVGGLIGVSYPETRVEDSYAEGDVSGNSFVGGLLGHLLGLGEEFEDGMILRSYSVGDVNGDEKVGGFVGSNGGKVENSFWDVDTTGQDTSDGGTGKTTDEMVKEETFTDARWDFEEDWDIIEDETYPFLQWQEEDTYPYPEEEDEGIPGFTSTLLLLAAVIAVVIYKKDKL